MEAVALTDHGRCGGLLALKEECNKVGIKPIFGLEAYVSPESRFIKEKLDNHTKTSYHLTLLAKNETGLRNLFRLTSIGWLEGFYYKNRCDLDSLRENSEGLVVLSGCSSGRLSTYLLEERDPKEINKHIIEMRDIWKDDFYIEVQNHKFDWQQPLRKTLFEVSKVHSIPIVATQDAHYLEKKDADLHRAICKLAAGNLEFAGEDLYLKSREEMLEVFDESEYHAIERTKEVADKCNCIWKHDKTIWPAYDLPKNKTADEILEELTYAGLNERFGEITEEYRQRVEYELRIIKEMGFSTYFLVVADFINWAKAQRIQTGPGRGSCAGSLVCYCMGITDIDPIEYNLYFERFLNPSRVSLPDADIDVCKRRRSEVITYIQNKYGEDKVAQIGTYSEFKPRGSLRDFARVMGYDPGVRDALSKLVPPDAMGKALSFDKCIELEPKLLKTDYPEVVDLARRAEKLITKTGIHAAGIVISDDEMMNYVPLFRGKHDEIATQFNMGDVENIGLVKFDLLGLKNLTVIQDTVDLVKEYTDTEIDISKIDREDQEVFENIFCQGKLDGIFQFETSSGIKDLCVQIKPKSIEDLSIINALHRPGPLKTGLTKEYAERRNGKSFKYPIGKLESSLDTTYGIIVFQEQVMRICRELAGYTLTESDNMRKCIVGSTKLRTKRGYEKIEDLVHKKVEILTLNNWQNKYNIAKNIFSSGEKETIKITTKSKTELSCTRDHKVYTQRGWIEACFLTKSDYVLHVLEEHYGSYAIEDEKLFLIAALVTEGYTSSDKTKTWYFCNKDKSYINKFSKCVKKIYGYVPKTITNEKNVTYCYLKKETSDDLIKFGYNAGLSKEKSLPDDFLNLKKEQLHELLGLLIDFDGYIIENFQVFYSTKSKKLAHQVKLIMETCGIGAYINSKTIDKGTYYAVGSGDSSDIKKFKEVLDGNCKKVKNIPNPMETDRGSTKYIFPKKTFLKEIKKILKPSGFKLNELVSEYRSGSLYNSSIGTNRAAKILKKCGRSKELEFFISKKAYWDRVEKIEEAGKQPVYDFTMSSEVSPWAYGNNLLIHNCIGKKLPDKMKLEREKFVSGCIKNDIPESAASELFKNIEGFADYSFNKSHSLSYSLISYQTAWLKYYYPVEFYCALFNNSLDDQDDLVKYFHACREEGIPIYPPDINKSDSLFKPEQGTIVFGFAGIKGIGEKACEELLEKRPEGGFKSLEEILERNVHSRTIKALAECGSLGSISEYGRGSIVEALPKLVEYQKKVKAWEERKERFGEREKERQIAIDKGDKPPRKLPKLPDKPEKPEINKDTKLTKEDRLKLERETLGFYITGHPLDQYIRLLSINKNTIERIKNESLEGSIALPGVVYSITEKRTKKNKNMATMILEDKTGRIEVIIFPNTWKIIKGSIEEGDVVIVSGNSEIKEINDDMPAIARLIAKKITVVEKEERMSNIVLKLEDNATIEFVIDDRTDYNSWQQARAIINNLGVN